MVVEATEHWRTKGKDANILAMLIYADFMKCDTEGKLPLACLGTHRDLEKYGITLEDGLELVFYNEDEDGAGNSDDLVVKCTVEFDGNNQQWRARIDRSAIKNISKLTSEERAELGIVL